MGPGDRMGRLKERRVQWALALLALGAWLLLWWRLGHGQLGVGPHRWDDFRYASRALEGSFDANIRNRYAHVWGLRLFYGMIDGRVAAAMAYAVSISLGLIATAFGLGLRVGGLSCGLLAAALLPFHPAVLRFVSTPLPDLPSALYGGLALLVALIYADGRRNPALAVLAGLLCFGALKSKETAVAVMPVVLWVLARDGHWLKPLGYWLAGAALGQAGLCAIDYAVMGDAFPSLRPASYQNYLAMAASEPSKIAGNPSRMRMEWMEVLLARDAFCFTLGAGLGFGLQRKRGLAMLALAYWTVATLLFSAWVSYRYTGIDALPRYLAAVVLPLSVGCASLIVELFRRAPGSSEDRPQREADPASGDWIHGLLRLGILLTALWLAYRGLQGGFAQVRNPGGDYAAQRAEYFLLPLVAPCFVFIAWTARHALVRRAALPVIVAASCLLPLPAASEYLRDARRETKGWQELARYVQDHEIRTLRRYKLGIREVNGPLVRWRLRALAELGHVKQRHSKRPQKLKPGELLLTTRSLARDGKKWGLRPVVQLRYGSHRLVAMDR